MFKIIPAIDILNGQAVRLTKGDYAQVKVYSNNPAEFAKKFEPFGFIHLVDLEGAKAGRPINLETLKKIRTAVNCKLEVGGGVRTKEDAKTLLDLGIDRIILGSIALKNKKLTEELVNLYGNKIAIGIDTKNGRVAAEGWLETSQTTGLALIKEMEKIGVKTVICTDITRDGTLTGPHIELYKELTEQTKINIVASGGIGNIDDVKALKKIKKLGGIIIGKAIYEERVSIEELLELA